MPRRKILFLAEAAANATPVAGAQAQANTINNYEPALQRLNSDDPSGDRFGSSLDAAAEN